MRTGLRVIARLLALLVAVSATPVGAAEGEAAVRQVIERDGLTITMEVDRDTITIDQQIRLAVTVDGTRNRIVTLPELADRLGPFIVVDRSGADEIESEAGGLRWERGYVLEVAQVGDLEIPALAVFVQATVTDEPVEIPAEPIPVTVTSVVPEGVDYTEPKDIAAPMAVTPPGVPLAVWIGAAGLALAALLALLARWWWRRYLARQPQPAHQLALAELDDLGALEGDPTRLEEFYIRLSGVVRRYLVWRFDVPAPMRTTDELLTVEAVNAAPIDERRQLLGSLLGGCDLVKFARHRPTAADMTTALAGARTFVMQTGDPGVLVDPATAR